MRGMFSVPMGKKLELWMNNSTCVKSSSYTHFLKTICSAFAWPKPHAQRQHSRARTHRCEPRGRTERNLIPPRCPAGGSQNSMPIGRVRNEDGFLDCRFIIRNHFSTRVMSQEEGLSIEGADFTMRNWSGPASERPLTIGSEEHKALFCRMLLETHNPYKLP